MTTLMFAAVLQVSIAGAGAENYADAHRETTETGKPLVVMVSTEWCVPCQQMKKTILPQIRKHGLFSKVCFAQVNPDQDQELAQKLTGGGPVPQLVMFRQTRQGWMRRKLIGAQSVETVEKFINEGIASNDESKNGKADSTDDDVAPENKHNKTVKKAAGKKAHVDG
jgi:thioredoxin-like negative regulator of GroEL